MENDNTWRNILTPWSLSLLTSKFLGFFKDIKLLPSELGVYFIVLEFCHSHLFSEYWKSPEKCWESIENTGSTVSSLKLRWFFFKCGEETKKSLVNVRFLSSYFCENMLYIYRYIYISSEFTGKSHIILFSVDFFQLCLLLWKLPRMLLLPQNKKVMKT